MATSSPRRGVRRGTTKSRRVIQWYDTLLNLSLPGSSVSTITLLGAMPLQDRKGTTIIRTLLDFRLRPNTAGTGGVADLGLLVNDDTAVLAGNIGDPSEATDQPSWMWRSRQLVVSSDVDDLSQTIHIKVDLKASRVIKGNEYTYILVLDNPNFAPISIFGIIRTLVKKP